MVEQSGTYELEFEKSRVFEFVSNPDNIATMSPSLEDSEAVGVADNGGRIIEADYSVGKGIAEGTATLQPLVFEPNDRIKYKIDDDIAGYIDWRFKSHSGSTIFEYDAEYTVEIPVPDFFMKTVGQHISQRELDVMVDNLRSELSEQV